MEARYRSRVLRSGGIGRRGRVTCAFVELGRMKDVFIRGRVRVATVSIVFRSFPPERSSQNLYLPNRDARL